MQPKNLNATLLLLILLVVTAISGCIADDEWDNTFHAQPASESKYPAHNESPSDHHEGQEQQTPHRQAPEEAYPDASPRYHNTLDGHEESLRSVNVPVGTETLRVALIHDSNADASFSLHEPFPLALPYPLQPEPVAEESVTGDKFMDEPDWVVIHDPLPDDWTFTIDVDGCSSYTAGFYVD